MFNQLKSILIGMNQNLKVIMDIPSMVSLINSDYNYSCEILEYLHANQLLSKSEPIENYNFITWAPFKNKKYGEDAKKMFFNPCLIQLPVTGSEDDLCYHFKIKKSKIDIHPVSSLVKAQDFALVNSLEEIIVYFN
ncbi:hypothetical protein DICPUDRAFT_160100 [Dictyostelium purpureum]|uniref:Uncharacterized protein n=1 Tax=Dictyostelium purpureum TaxID=5786 RepID=F1A5Q5_DICPU|nr:uncharacterized protein DICPUDRAFT_160100 [Dictyostelium purpureum]EGC28478.1 hypothetical protein DICPUDRAFT_160100 [Dictyostelium purpureum]|eukprot:XP_003294999.1 hypothetical protein DICPUDRAFT_160100 [Dictyostelium purpureum]